MATSSIPSTLRRALLYVPGSSPKFLAKSLTLPFPTDNITYDLEDSVTPHLKPKARAALHSFLTSLPPSRPPSLSTTELAVRINAITTPHFEADLQTLATVPALDAIVIPKVTSPADLETAISILRAAAPDRYNVSSPSYRPFALLALIESARAVTDLKEICSWSWSAAAAAAAASKSGVKGGKEKNMNKDNNLRGLIFAAEDFALDLSLTRTPDLTEFLYARSAVVTAARAFGLESAIDLVCTTLQKTDPGRLPFEVANGKGLGFNGKQCIHPTQVPIVQELFSPDKKQVEWAVRVSIADDKAAAQGRGAWTLDGKMIDAPVSGKARAIVQQARQCGLDVDGLMDKFKDQEPE